MPIRRDHDRPTERELAALADGSIPPARRARVERAVAASPELQAQLRDQRHALAAVLRATNELHASAVLRSRVADVHAARTPTRVDPVLLGGAAGAAGAAAAAALLLATGGGHARQPSVTAAAALGARPAAATVSEATHGRATLERPVLAGLHFPYWRDRFGWKAIGVRYDRLVGRPATTVFYRRRSAVVSYTIVAGRPLPESHATTPDGRIVVTLHRRGHTCVLSSARTPRATLLRLAAWRGEGDITF
jgi:hypothetical protein